MFRVFAKRSSDHFFREALALHESPFSLSNMKATIDMTSTLNVKNELLFKQRRVMNNRKSIIRPLARYRTRNDDRMRSDLKRISNLKTQPIQGNRSLIENGPIPQYNYIRDPQTILKPQFSGANAWAGLLCITGINLGVLLYWNREETDMEWMLKNFTTNIHNVTEGRIWTLATASISHQAFPHFLGNMFGLWLFGFPLYRVIGPTAFFSLYFMGGVCSSVAQVLGNFMSGRTDPPLTKEERDALDKIAQSAAISRKDPYSSLPQSVKERLMHADVGGLGASGSLMAISAVAAALFPLDRIRVHYSFAPLPLPVGVALFMISDLLGVTMPEQGDNVGHLAHLGGSLFGITYVTMAWRSGVGSFENLHKYATGGELPIVFRFRQLPLHVRIRIKGLASLVAILFTFEYLARQKEDHIF